MTDEQINAAIARECGDYICECCKDICKDCDKNYCTDLNAMHEAEKVLTISQEREYFFRLKQIVGDLIWYRSTCQNYRATARQRAEAFLRTLGKLEDALGNARAQVTAEVNKLARGQRMKEAK